MAFAVLIFSEGFGLSTIYLSERRAKKERQKSHITSKRRRIDLCIFPRYDAWPIFFDDILWLCDGSIEDT